MLFADKDRTRLEPIGRNENKFAFNDESAIAAFDQYRVHVNDWLSMMPEDARVDAENQFQGPHNWQYDAGIVELMIFRALVGLGHDVEVHPLVNGRNPDFLVRDGDGRPLAYVEVTTTNTPTVVRGAQGRRNDVIDGLDRLDLPPGWIGGITGVLQGKTAPSINTLRRQIEAWARTAPLGKNRALSQVFKVGDWEIEFRLDPASTPDFKPSRAVSVEMLGMREFDPSKSVRNALDRKGGRYGIEDTPFLIVVADGRGEVGEEGLDVLRDVLFGNQQVVFTRSGHHEERANNGFFGRIGEGRNSHVSGVLLLPDTDFLSLYETKRELTFILNADATNPLPQAVLPISRYDFDPSQGRFAYWSGRTLIDLLALPAQRWW